MMTAIDIKCDFCGSDSGIRCKKPSGWMYNSFHKVRLEAFNKSPNKVIYIAGEYIIRVAGDSFVIFKNDRFVASCKNFKHATNIIHAKKQQTVEENWYDKT